MTAPPVNSVTVTSTSILTDPTFYAAVTPVVLAYIGAEFGIHPDAPTVALVQGVLVVVARYFSNRPVHVPLIQSVRFLRLPGAVK